MRRALELERDAAAAATARAWLTDALSDPAVISGPARADLLVMASELVTNVISHTRSRPRIAVSCDDDEVLVEVGDDSPDLPQVRDLEPDRVGGNGLRIVEAWSRRWGVERHPDDGKTVWFTVATQPA
ncbi:ATP-binding protein [Aquihabitans sp. G128]|uniref:ATP-binding protein n=1 Tax=Aquihabitans sp. G128 TaxID=2849779 RepID=UPI001C241346|nr:ATP-binding protein [Aquihabitans sp. G128]QXC61102.1 ATP-binding protein [Aquihabitans sp. G128]